VGVGAEVDARNDGNPGVLEEELGDVGRASQGPGRATDRRRLAEEFADVGERIERTPGMTQLTPGSALSPSTMRRRRRSNSPAILATSSWGPVSASTAAHCAIEDGLDVTWLWTFVMARMSSREPAAYPIRQPVIA